MQIYSYSNIKSGLGLIVSSKVRKHSYRLSEIDGHGNLFVLSINKWSVLMVSNKINQYSHGVIE